jgi:nondiscriminating glutamyl-tRNA synthetase
MTPVRVRFAPSPTGHLHVGNVRTALFNWLFARHHGGTFVLRIEDTDAERSTALAERAILEDLRWLGLDWDEGPDVGGAFGPYRQSDRGATYAEAAGRLLASGHAYYCFCAAAQLETERQTALQAGRVPMYSGRCRGLDRAEAARRIAAGTPAAVRFAVPRDAAVTFTDLVRGPVTVAPEMIGDPVIVRSTGMPAYNFAVVVDDAGMAVTHVVRGEDHVSNTPRQILIYRALGHEPPAFAHLSLVLGPDHAPLSKRHGATSVVEFRDTGVLPEALINYLALLGWSPGADEEIVPLAEMAKRFDLTDVGRSASVFDTAKLAWVNRHYLRAADPSRIVRVSLPHFRHDGFVTETTDAGLAYLVSLLPMVVGSVDRLAEIPERLAFLFRWDLTRAAALVREDPNGAAAVRAFEAAIEPRGGLDRDGFRAAAAEARGVTGLKGKALFHPIRVMLTGEESGPELDLAVPAIDRGAALEPSAGIIAIPGCRARARAVLAALGGS